MSREHLYLRSLVQASKALRFASGLAPTKDDAQHVRWLSRYVVETLCDEIARCPRDLASRGGGSDELRHRAPELHRRVYR